MTALNKQALRESAIHAQSNDDWGCDGDNFHDQATPDVVLALLDELVIKEEQRTNWFQMAQKLGEDLDVAEKRIAELEAREVELPKLKMLSDYLAEVTQREREDILVGVKLEFHRMLTAAGIGVKGE